MTDMTDNARDMIDLTSRSESAPADVTPPVPSNIPTEELDRITADVVDALKTVFDPEIPVDIYELGLIYKVDLDDDRTMHITMTLTAPGCPVAGEMPMWVHDAAATVDGVEKVKVELVFEPPWTPDRMTDEARLALNML
jgi:FeS assembly SUF system protein